MITDEARRWVDRLVGACVCVLIGALSLYAAVWLLRCIWPELLIVGLYVVGIALLVGWWRSRW